MLNPILQLLAIMVFPAAISGASTYFGRASISRPGWYFSAATLLSYVAYIAVFYAIAETLHGGFAFTKPNPAAAVQVRSSTPNLFALYAKPLMVFIVVTIPIVMGLNRVFHKS